VALTLYVKRDRWRSHLDKVLAANPGLVPVAKGTGYGVGLRHLADEADSLGVGILAVGQYDEVATVSAVFTGSFLVLTPWRPFHDVPLSDGRLIHTVSRLQDLRELAESGHRLRLVLEHVTSMLRHGMSTAELLDAIRIVVEHPDLILEGLTLHLPLSEASEVAEVETILAALGEADFAGTVFVSHLSTEEIGRLAGAHPRLTFRPRIGTDLWLGDRGALSVESEVLDVHPLAKGQTFGYRGRTARSAGTLLVVSGGSTHGVGLEAPVASTGARSRFRHAAKATLESVGYARSPFFIGDAQCMFAEPPHMQVSLILVPEGVRAPEVGDLVSVRVRFTTTHVDRVRFS
jgi:hypothetical protein